MKRIAAILCVCFSVAACQHITPDASHPNEAVVHIKASISPEMTVSTKAAFAHNSNYGIFVCQNGSTSLAHKSNSWNILAKYLDPYYSGASGGWWYYYVANLSSGAVAKTGYENITLTAREDGRTADLYAYAPYKEAAYRTDPTAIQYKITRYDSSGQDDLMYAQENLDPSSNKGLDPTSGADLNASFTFKHALALLKFKFRLMNDASTSPYGSSSNVVINYCDITLNDPDSDGVTTAKLIESGTFNAVTGVFNNDGQEVSIMRIYYGSQDGHQVSSTTYTDGAKILLVPTEVADDELVFSFTANGQIIQPFYLKREYLQHSDGVTYGLQSGCVYTFFFTLDNYVYFDGFSVGSWDSDVLGSEEI